MTLLPRDKRLRGILGGCAALAAVMAGPVLVDASAQAMPQSSCISGGVCLTPVSNTTVTVPVTTTTTVTSPVTTTQTSIITATTTKLSTTTVPVTDTETTTVEVPVTDTETTTVPVTMTTTTTTAPVTTTTTTTTTTALTTIAGVVRVRPETVSTKTTTSAQCTPPGHTASIGNGQVETCGPGSGPGRFIAVYGTAPGLYTKIFDNDSADYVSVGLFAPQYRNGHLFGCYYVPDSPSVTAPGQTSNVANGVLADATAFGPHSWSVSVARQVPRFDCA
jgi:hypothetical protein